MVRVINGDSTKESAKDEMILTLIGCVCRIWGCNTSDGNGGWWWSMSAINEVMKIITFKKRLDLKAPCEIIGG